MGARERVTYRAAVPGAVECSGCGQLGFDLVVRTVDSTFVPYEIVTIVAVCPACDLIEKVNTDA